MQFDGSLLLQLVFVAILIGVNAFFASSEIAIISVNDNKIRKMAEEGHKKAGLLQKMISEPSRFLATIQVGITLSGFLASAFAAESFADRLSNAVKWMGLPVDEAVIKILSLVVITILLSYFTLVFGELVPKRIAMQKSEQIALMAIKPLSVLSRVTSPFVKLLTLSTNYIITVFGGNPNADEENITEEEIRMMVDVGQERGVILGSEKEMIDNIFEFDNTLVSEIMTHRTDIVAIPINATLEDIVEIVVNEKYTRIPVYEDVIDNIVGILHSKDLVQYFRKGNKYQFDLKEVVRQPYYVPESKKTDQLFREFQKNKIHMAVVIDEYGGTAGIVTIEDLLEEIVGNIWDEYDEEIKEIEKIDDTTFLLQGTMELDTAAEFLKVKLPVDSYETLSGFIIGQLGRIPEEGDQPIIEYEGFVFKVEGIDDKRITQAKVCKAL